MTCRGLSMRRRWPASLQTPWPPFEAGARKMACGRQRGCRASGAAAARAGRSPALVRKSGEPRFLCSAGACGTILPRRSSLSTRKVVRTGAGELPSSARTLFWQLYVRVGRAGQSTLALYAQSVRAAGKAPRRAERRAKTTARTTANYEIVKASPFSVRKCAIHECDGPPNYLEAYGRQSDLRNVTYASKRQARWSRSLDCDGDGQELRPLFSHDGGRRMLPDYLHRFPVTVGMPCCRGYLGGVD